MEIDFTFPKNSSFKDSYPIVNTFSMTDLQTEFLHLVGTLMGYFLKEIALLKVFGLLTQNEF